MCCSLVGKNHVCYDCMYRDFPQTAQPTLYALITLAFFIPPLSVDRSLPYDFTVLCSPKCLLLFLFFFLFLKFLVSCPISLCKKRLCSWEVLWMFVSYHVQSVSFLAEVAVVYTVSHSCWRKSGEMMDTRQCMFVALRSNLKLKCFAPIQACDMSKKNQKHSPD